MLGKQFIDHSLGCPLWQMEVCLTVFCCHFPRFLSLVFLTFFAVIIELLHLPDLLPHPSSAPFKICFLEILLCRITLSFLQLLQNSSNNFPWASRLWVGRRKEPILVYVPKNDEKKNLVHKGLNKNSFSDSLCRITLLDKSFIGLVSSRNFLWKECWSLQFCEKHLVIRISFCFLQIILLLSKILNVRKKLIYSINTINFTSLLFIF